MIKMLCYGFSFDNVKLWGMMGVMLSNVVDV